MTAAKVAVTISAQVLKLARAEVKAGRAASLSALVSEAVGEKVERNRLADILDAMDREHGIPSKSAERWAKRVLRRSS